MVIDGKIVAIGAQCFIIAEAGVNHNGDIGLARQLIDAAADAGADAVKFQTFSADHLATPEAATAAYQRSDGGPSTQHEMLRQLELSLDDFGDLMRHCAKQNITFLSTPFDERSATELVRAGMSAIKVPSGEITNARLLRHVAALARPIILSTGMSTLAEVAEAIGVLRRTAPDVELALLHCVSCYPAEPNDTNLRAMATMQREFGLPVGLSDHTLGLDVPIAAAALGAVILEKHLTLDRTMRGPDHAASLEPNEFTRLVDAVRIVESSLGDGVKRPVEREAETASVARRSLAAARDLSAGETIASADIVLLRPGTGLRPSDEPQVVGRRLRQPISRGALFRADLLE